jgi:hypothetical protein
MMATMLAVEPDGALAFLHRPTTTTLSIVVICAVLGWGLHWYAGWSTRPRFDSPGAARRPAPLANGILEPPAVVAMLTNGYDVPRSAVAATTLDLAARGWVRLTTIEDELVVVTRGNAATGDTLRPFEQQVLNHLAARAFNDVTSANTLAASHHRLDRRWWLRYGRAVVAQSQELGLSSRRYTALELVPAAVAAFVGLVACWVGARGGEPVAVSESWKSRLVWVLALVALVALAWQTAMRVIGSAQRPTDLGVARSAAWIGYRGRLRDRIPAHASVLAPPAQQIALAQASVMGVAEHVLDEIPVAPEDPHAAWSEAGGTPHVVRVRYPSRPGYGQHPLKVGAVGVVVFFASRWVRGFLNRVSDGESLQSLLDRAPGQVDLIEKIADLLAIACWLPIIWGAWAVLAGAIDSVATRERLGSVVRARRPVEVLPPLLVNVVKPLAERDRFSTYLAVDDGKRSWITAWLANERSAAPQGAQAKVRATPLLGYVRSSEPVGTATRSVDSGDR